LEPIPNRKLVATLSTVGQGRSPAIGGNFCGAAWRIGAGWAASGCGKSFAAVFNRRPGQASRRQGFLVDGNALTELRRRRAQPKIAPPQNRLRSFTAFHLAPPPTLTGQGKLGHCAFYSWRRNSTRIASDRNPDNAPVLAGRLHHKPSERLRLRTAAVAIARTIINEPKIPSSADDPTENLIRKLETSADAAAMNKDLVQTSSMITPNRKQHRISNRTAPCTARVVIVYGVPAD